MTSPRSGRLASVPLKKRLEAARRLQSECAKRGGVDALLEAIAIERAARWPNGRPDDDTLDRVATAD